MYWIAVFSLPLVVGLQRYAVAYGYEGESRTDAWKSARCVAGIAALVSCLLIIAKFY